ncbi:zf-HC2 domain-containing protein [Streptomyces sp. NPDC001941]|uniref:zf-HC2 domain-containing protein n=1 Tax=Streptomyces sp. NPDC001941 TaxID=3154659 RepID=UPI003320C032
MTPSHQDPRTEVGAYVLGALDPQESDAFEAHMLDCPACAGEARELADVETLLADFAATGPDLEELLADEPPAGARESAEAPAAEDPGPARLVSRLRDVRRRAFMLAASVALFGGGIGLGVTWAKEPPAPAVDASQNPQWAARLLMVGEQHNGANAATGVTAKVGLEDKKWGTHIALELRGVHGPLDCRLVAVSTSGARQTVTGWVVPEPGYGIPGSPDPLQVHGGVSVPRGQLDRFEVVTRDGRQLVSIDV